MRRIVALLVALAAHLAGKDAEFLTLYQASYSTSPNPLFNATSPPFYPSPWMDGKGEWADAYAKAKEFVSQLTLLEKVNLTTGVGWEGEQCVGQVCIFKDRFWDIEINVDRLAQYLDLDCARCVCRILPWVSETQITTASSPPGKL